MIAYCVNFRLNKPKKGTRKNKKVDFVKVYQQKNLLFLFLIQSNNQNK